jgi:large repetitive protein
MKKLFCLPIVVCAIVLLAFVSVVSAQPQAICVPWQPSSPSIAHYTYSGAEITLKGIARDGATTYTWDFGDGSTPMVSTPIVDPYNLGIKHTYTGTAGQLFIATLTVSDGTDTHQDTYPVRIYESSDLSNPDHLDARINMAIDEGLWWLHTNMIRDNFPAGGAPDYGYGQPYGHWDLSVYHPLAVVGAAIDAFQLHGSKANMDYDSDPYVETVQRGLNVLLRRTYAFQIGTQPAGDPDTNGNGIGLVTNYWNDWPSDGTPIHDGRETYVGGICMVALASSGAPNRVAALGRDHVYGRTYAEIVQDMVDFFAWGQADPATTWARGGWRYYANSGDADMSTTQWPALGMTAAEENMGSTVPQFVRDELIYFLNQTQHTDCDSDNGGFGYNHPNSMLNDTKAGAGIICHEFLGTPLTDPKVQSAIGFLYRHWNDTASDWTYQQFLGNSYGMYAVMKAMRIPEPDITRITEYDCTIPGQTADSFDWYYSPNSEPREGLAHYIVRTQLADGHWDDVPGPNPVYHAFSTGWRVLILLKGVAIIPPNAVICDCDEQEYNLNQDVHLSGVCSNHPDITRHIISYEWDLDNDGEFEDATGETVTITGGFSATGLHPVTLRVTDDNPEGAQTSTYTCQIDVHPPPHCPHAFADGPYIGWVNTPVTFDASASWDPDNEIVSYEWDLDNDGLFGTEDDDCFGESDDAVGVNPQWTWDTLYRLSVIGLRVTDAEGEFDACSDIDYSTVEIGNHAPVSDPNGPYLASPGSTITLDGTGSYDPDPEDTITYAWDLDNNGEFDDSTDTNPTLTVGSVIGTVYNICLKVTDSFGETNVKCTTVTISPNLPPDCSNAYADPGCLWPPNHKFIDITIEGVEDPDSDPVTITIDAITSDEATASEKGAGGKKHAPDASGIGTDTASVRAERSGKADGRVYVIHFTASDGRGGECEGSVKVNVPHDQSSRDCPAIDSGQNYDATSTN